MQVLADLVMSMCLLFHPLFGNFLLADFFLDCFPSVYT
jgi:hypothetical protein